MSQSEIVQFPELRSPSVEGSSNRQQYMVA